MKTPTATQPPTPHQAAIQHNLRLLKLVIGSVAVVAILAPLMAQLILLREMSIPHLLPALLAPLTLSLILYVVLRHWIVTQINMHAMRAQLDHSEALYRTMISAMAEGVVLQGPDGQITTCNAAAERILGLTADQMTERTSKDPRWRTVREDGSPFPGDEHPVMITLRTGEPQNNVVMGVHKPDGQLTWINICTAPLFDSTQPERLTGVIATFTDITALIEQQQKFRALFDKNQDAIFFLDLNEAHIAANASAHQLLGYAPGEIIGLKRKDMIVPEELDDGDTMLNIARSGKTLPLYERTFMRKDGSRIQLEMSIQLIRDVEGTPLYIQSIGRDVTDRRKRMALLAEKQRLIESIAEVSPTMIIVHEMQSNRFIYVNRAVELFAERTMAEIFLNHDTNQLNVCPDDQTSFDHFVRKIYVMKSDDVVSAEFRLLNGKGEWRWLLVRSVRMHISADLEYDQVLHIALDITDRKATEQTTLDLRLERERSALIRNFIRDISHEFRTPLALINTNAYLVQRFDDPQKRASTADRITQQVDLINRLVDSLVLLSELESTNPARQPMDLSLLLQDLITKHTPYWHGKNLDFAPYIPAPLPVEGDYTLLARALDSLLDNAGRYTPDGGCIAIGSVTTSEAVMVTFFNSNASLTPALLPHLFERFYRQDTAHTTSGLGLGLPIARKIAELHGGKLDAALSDDGVCFTFTLPISA